MKLFRDVVCQYAGKGQGCPLISATLIDSVGVVPLAKGKAPVQSTSYTNQGPWADQAPYLREIFHNAQHNYVNRVNQQPYGGQTFANFSPQTENALNLTEQRAMAGSPIQRSANQQLQQTLNGDYLHGGQGFNAAYQAAANEIIPGVESRFNAGGRFGSGLARQAETKALGDAFAAQYGNERQNQLRAMLFAPEAAQADYNDIRALAGVGQAREGQTQSGIDEAMWRHQAQQEMPWELLAKYQDLINGGYGANATTTSYGPKTNKGAGILGGALGGAALGTQISPGWGTAIGGGLGALGGLF